MYSIDGIALENPGMGWTVQGGSEPLPSFSAELASVKVPGRDGVMFDSAATLDATLRKFVVRTPRENLPALHALVMSGGVLTSTDAPGRSAEVEFVSSDTTHFGMAIPFVDLTFVLRVPEVMWRGGGVSKTQNLTASSHVVQVMSGLSARVPDSVCYVNGPCAGVRVADSGGSWWTYTPAIPSGQRIRFEAASGRAFQTASGATSGGTEVSGVADYGGPRGVFELTPFMTDNPAARVAQVTVTTSSRSSPASLTVSAYPAYAI